MTRRLALSALLALLLLPSTDASFAVKAKKKGGGKKAKAAPVAAKGFGAPVAAKKGGALPSVGDAALDAALAARCTAIKKQKKNAQAWLELGSLLVKANEYAEAERVFRAGAAVNPENEMLSAAALTLGGDSAAYMREGAQTTSAPPDHAIDDDCFDAFVAPVADLHAVDQADRNVAWKDSDAKSRGAVFKSKGALLDPDDCKWVIEQVEAQAAISGWTTDRHVQAPTTDIPVSEVPAIRDWFDEMLRTRLFPFVHSRFPGAIKEPSCLRVFDAFVVRYDAREQASLPTHQDENTFSFTIALNDRSEYEGGGTAFERLRPAGSGVDEYARTVLNADAGGVVAFPGKLKHGGNVVTSGRRYIIPLFLYADQNRLQNGGKEEEVGYVLRHLGVELPEGEQGLSRYAKKVLDEL